MTRSAAKASTVSTTHTIFVAAPPRAVYDLLADAARWPLIFSTSVHVDKLEAGATGERLRWWAVANGAIRDWTTRRTFDPGGLRIRFRQETPLPPVASMAGEWVLVPLPGNVTSVVLLHEFRAIGDDPGNTALIRQAVDRNSTAELAELKTAAELGDKLPHLVHSFADTVIVNAGLGPVYDFLYRVGEWPVRLPHVARVIMDEAVPNVQTVEIQTHHADGPPQTARMVRVCSPHHSIVYKRIDPQDTISAHVGGWYLYPTADGVRLTAHNTVMIRPGAVFGVAGLPGMPALTGLNGSHSPYGLNGNGLSGGNGVSGINGVSTINGVNGAARNGVNRLHVGNGLNGTNGTNGTAAHDHRFAGAVEWVVEQVRQSLRENCLAVLAHAKKMAAENAEQLSLRDSRTPTSAIWVD